MTPCHLFALGVSLFFPLGQEEPGETLQFTCHLLFPSEPCVLCIKLLPHVPHSEGYPGLILPLNQELVK